MKRPSYELNEEHINNPVPGDYWNEMLVMYHAVLRVLPNGNRIIADKDRSVTDGQRPDLSQALKSQKRNTVRKLPIVSTSLDMLLTWCRVI